MKRLTLEQRYQIWALDQLETDPLFYRQIVFSDEAHFWLNGFVNKQNCRIWSDTNSQATLQTPLHPANAPFGSTYTLVASSDLISSKIRPELALRSMEIVTAP